MHADGAVQRFGAALTLLLPLELVGVFYGPDEVFGIDRQGAEQGVEKGGAGRVA